MTAEHLRHAQVQSARTVLGEYSALISGQWLKTGDIIEVRSLYDNSPSPARTPSGRSSACITFTDPLAAIEVVDTGDFDLQAGLFTHDTRLVQAALDRVGGLMVNDVSTLRVDQMPCGGVKHSGFGREGLRYAIEEMTDMKFMMVNNRPCMLPVPEGGVPIEKEENHRAKECTTQYTETISIAHQ